MPKPATLTPDRPHQQLQSARACAALADGVDFVAIAALLAFHWQAEPLVFGGFALAAGLPYLLIGRSAARIAARGEARTLLAASLVGRGAATAAMLAASAWPMLFVLIALRGVADCLFAQSLDEAAARLPPDEAGDGQEPDGLAGVLAGIAAPALAGAILIFVTPAALLAGTALFALWQGAALTRLPALPAPEVEPVGRPAPAALPRGRGARVAFCVLALATAALLMAEALAAPLVRAYGFGPALLGAGVAALGAGGALGSAWLQRWPGPPPFWRMTDGALGAAIALGGLGAFAATGLAPGAVVIVLAFAAAGLSLAACSEAARAVLEPFDTSGYWDEAARASALLGPPLAAAFAGIAGIGAAFGAGGGCLALAARLAFRAHRANQARPRPAARPKPAEAAPPAPPAAAKSVRLAAE